LFAAEGAVVDIDEEKGAQVVDGINRSGKSAIFFLCNGAFEEQVRTSI